MKDNTSRSSSCSSLKLCLLSILFLTETVVAIKLPPNLKIPALIAFGDSIVDTGNNNNVKTVVKCDFQPYGINFQGGVPTGRFCDGRVPADLLAEEVGIKSVVPAYLDPNLTPKDLLTGVSFASGGSSYDPITPKLVKLYGYGVRRIAVFGAPPLGCIPSQRTLGGGLLRECAEYYNDAAKLFNSKISTKLDYLLKTLPDSKPVYINIYDPLYDIIQNPTKYGFGVSNKGCCGTGAVEVAVLCNKITSSVCPDVSSHVFWDSYHPTEKTYKVLVSLLIDKFVNQFI
ncbi:hypothetical protein HID58_065804 [Brassica napus]|uniref:Uncharacterized protein n=1 Tax=Brassica napus TaxID=3708 RepID=A0ABQ7ZEA3_BRANA|nr:hypothetical protein HID58_065804 [Brassica napus]